MIGKNIYNYAVLDSTNDFIKANPSQFESGDVVVAEEQTKGRGRFGNLWLSEKGNLYFSFIIKEAFERGNLFLIIMKSALAVRNTLMSFKIRSTIKYPNDIMVNKKKISGILMESSGYEKIDTIIVGIGININQKKFPKMETKATSMFAQLKRTYSPKELLNSFILEFNKLESSKNIYEMYSRYLVLSKKKIKFDGITYKISRVEPTGEIIIANSNGTKRLEFGDFSFRG